MSNRLKVTAALGLAASIAVVPGTACAQPGKPAPVPTRPGPTAIPRASFIADMEAQFRAMDTDRNGMLTVAEIQASQRKMAAARNAARARALFVGLDNDKNGQISQDEFAKIPLPDTQPDARPIVSRFDTNKDNSISLVEYRGGTLVNFDRLDSDKDGIASPAEMRTAGIGR